MASLRDMLGQIKENEQDPEKMKLKEYIAYALGNWCYGSIAHLANQYLNKFYLALGLSPTRAASVISATKIYDSVNDPIVATIIDNGKGKKGRFKPYLAPLVPLLALLSVVMFLRPPMSGISGIMFWCFLSYALWETVNTFSGIAFQAIGTIMSTDMQERTLYTTIGNMGTQLAGMVPGLIPVAYQWIKDHNLMQESTFFTWCAVLFAAIGLATGMFTKNLKERVPPPKKQEHFWDAFVTFFQNRHLLLLWSSNLSQLIGSAGNGWLFYEYSLGNTNLQALQWALAGAPHFLAVLLSPYLIKRFRPSRIIIATNLLNAACYFATYAIVKPMGYASTPGIVITMALSVIAWVPFGISDVARNILQMNTFDYTAKKTGKRAEATSLMVTNMLGKWVTAAAALIGGFALAKIGFQEGEGVLQSQATKDGLFFIFTIFPAVGSLLAAIPIFFFNLEGKEFERRMAEFSEVDREKEKLAAGIDEE